MPEKRLRSGRSASLGEIDPANPRHQVESPAEPWERRTAPFAAPRRVQSPVKNSKTFVAKPEQSRRKILTLESPVRETNMEIDTGERGRWFLEACYYCKKKLNLDLDVFMYGYMQAFCSPECRDEQIDLDTEAEAEADEASGEPTKRITTESCCINNMKDLSSAQTEKRAAA
ncbi:hypothetical protein HHK36_026756 [Tetracentron sinense]|uniref:FLZ-type domain-containing protein n=1 Tax=Tetracentron sinense TaxID=13715 RepID=A0A834YHF8_TETSI|nr:hypothetical protein HHK36_026756 [Tetracentron sinense]